MESDGDAAQRLVCDLVTTRLPRSYGFDPIRDIQVLCPTKLGPTGTQALNVELQNLLNPEQTGKPQLQSAARVFRVGDKVMQVRNNYEIIWNRIGGEQGVGAYNGDIGIVESINMRDRSMVVRMDDKRLVYPAENLGELEIALCHHGAQKSGQRVPGGDPAGGAGAAAAVLPQPVLHRRYPCTEAVHRGGPQGRCEPHDGQHPPEPALQRPCLSFAGRAAAGTDGSRQIAFSANSPEPRFRPNTLSGPTSRSFAEKLSAVLMAPFAPADARSHVQSVG